MRLVPRLAAIAALSLAAMPAMAVKIERIDIRGLDEAMTENVRTNLSLEDSVGKVVTGRRMGYLVRVAEEETREALHPFGYYSPTIVIQRSDRSAPESDTDDADATPRADTGNGRRDPNRPVRITITVDKGKPVTVRNRIVEIEGDASDDKYLAEELDAFAPQPGAVLDHSLYEASKARITRRLAERGYFDADFIAHRVEVTRADYAADIDLRWNSGDRYDMGAVGFVQEPKRIIRPQLLEKLVYWNEGEYYHQGRLDRLRQSLLRLDYFSAIDIEPRPDEAISVTEEDGSVSRRVPVTVTLTPAKRSIYTSGLSYGTDSGAGVRFGVERRYVNDRGHKALAQVDWAQNRKTATVQYRIPAFAWLDGWYTGSVQFADEQTDYIDTRRLEFVASRSGQYNRHLNLVASVHALRERWAYAFEDDGDDSTPVLYKYANYFFPALRAEYADVDDRFIPRRGIGGTVVLRAGGGRGDTGSATFAQAHARASWFKGLGPNDRLIVRGELGHTFTNALNDLPPSLRFYAGGDRSIRGYNWREVGPVEENDEGEVVFALGAKNVVTASIEYERYFQDSPWGAAVFVDTGDAFNGGDDPMSLRTGVGAGVRWKSPVGPIRIDIARGLDDPDSPFTIHLNLGTDL